LRIDSASVPTSRSPRRLASVAALLRWAAPLRRLSTMDAAASVTRPPSHKKLQDRNAGRRGLVPPRLARPRRVHARVLRFRPVPSPSPGAAAGSRLCGKKSGRTMTFAGTNYLAIVIAAVVAWLAGAGWYMALGKTWMAALGVTPAQMEEAKRRPGA